MRRVILAIASTVTALVLLLSFKTHSASSLATPPAAVSSTTTTTTTPSTTTSSTTKSRTKSATTSTTVTGDAVDTRYGPVQVQVTVTNGKVTAAKIVSPVFIDPEGKHQNV